MKDGGGAVRLAYIRSLLVAAVLIFTGEAAGFVVWGLILHPEEDHFYKFLWTMLDALVMAVTVGLLAGLVADRRYDGVLAGLLASLCYAIVLVAGLLASYKIDLETNRFGAGPLMRGHIVSSLVTALIMSPLYGWLLHSKRGRTLLKRCGL